MSKWQYGCGERVETGYFRGHEYRTIALECGSTGPSGDVVQCESCAVRHPVLSVLDDEESDGEWQARMDAWNDDN